MRKILVEKKKKYKFKYGFIYNVKQKNKLFFVKPKAGTLYELVDTKVSNDFERYKDIVVQFFEEIFRTKFMIF